MFDWEDFFSLSKKLRLDTLNPGAIFSEAIFRVTVSRSYYAAYHKVKDYADKNLNYKFPHYPDAKNAKKSTKGSHLDLIDFLKFYPDDKANGVSYQTIRDLGSELDLCKDARTKCDYHVYVPNVERVSSVVERRVHDILLTVK